MGEGLCGSNVWLIHSRKGISIVVFEVKLKWFKSWEKTCENAASAADPGVNTGIRC